MTSLVKQYSYVLNHDSRVRVSLKMYTINCKIWFPREKIKNVYKNIIIIINNIFPSDIVGPSPHTPLLLRFATHQPLPYVV